MSTKDEAYDCAKQEFCRDYGCPEPNGKNCPTFPCEAVDKEVESILKEWEAEVKHRLIPANANPYGLVYYCTVCKTPFSSEKDASRTICQPPEGEPKMSEENKKPVCKTCGGSKQVLIIIGLQQMGYRPCPDCQAKPSQETSEFDLTIEKIQTAIKQAERDEKKTKLKSGMWVTTNQAAIICKREKALLNIIARLTADKAEQGEEIEYQKGLKKMAYDTSDSLRADKAEQATEIERLKKMDELYSQVNTERIQAQADLKAKEEEIDKYRNFIQEELNAQRKLVAEEENDPVMRPFAQVMKGLIARYRTVLGDAPKGR